MACIIVFAVLIYMWTSTPSPRASSSSRGASRTPSTRYTDFQNESELTSPIAGRQYPAGRRNGSGGGSDGGSGTGGRGQSPSPQEDVYGPEDDYTHYGQLTFVDSPPQQSQGSDLSYSQA